MKTCMVLMLALLVMNVKLLAEVKEVIASDTAAIEVFQEENTFFVRYFTLNEQERDVVVSIFNEQNEVVFSESFKNKGSFKRPYNFEGLPAGIYIIKITDAQKVSIRPVQYMEVEKEHAQKALEELKRKLVLRVMEVEGERAKFKVGIYANEEVDLILSILNNKRELVFKEEVVSKTVKVYDLSTTFSGKFYFQLLDTRENLIHEVVQ